jgi:small-conductance mechanosensitive channel/CRP-like cAMP-binding protein
MSSDWLSSLFTAPLFPLGRQTLTLGWLLQATFLLVVVTLTARLLRFVLAKRLLVWLGIPEGRREAIGTLVALGLAALGYVVVAQGMGLDFGALAVLFGALGVGVGFGLQDLTRNLSSGLTLLMEGKLKVGDLIEFENSRGFIREISFRSTVIRTFQGSEIVLPNAMITNAPVHNLSYGSSDGRVDVAVNVLHGSDPVQVTEALLEAALAEPEVLSEPPPKVVFQRIGREGLEFDLWVWTEAIHSQVLLRSALNYAIQRGLRRRGIALVGEKRIVQMLSSRDVPQPPSDREPAPLEQQLAAVPCFRDLDRRGLQELIVSGARRSVAAGTVLIHRGEPGRSLLVVLEGRIAAIHETDRISHQLFSFGEGEFFGELPLLLQVPYPTTMWAPQDTLLFELPSGSFRQLLEARPDFAESVAQAVSRRSDVLRSYEACLRERGLLESGDLGRPLQWLRGLLRRFTPPPGPAADPGLR